MAEKQLTLKEIDTKIKALDVKIEKTQETLLKLKADKKALVSEQTARRAQNAAKAPGKKTAAAKTTAAKKTTTASATKKTTAAKKTTTAAAQKAPAKKKEEASNGMLGELVEGLLSNKEIANALGDLLGKK